MEKASNATTQRFPWGQALRIKFLSNNINTLYKVLAELEKHEVSGAITSVRNAVESLECEYVSVIQNCSLPDESL